MSFDEVRGDEAHGPVSEADVRAMVRLVGESAGLEQDIAARKRFLMSGLCDLVDADAWFWSCACNSGTPGEAPMTLGYLYDGFTPKQLASFVAAQTHPDVPAVLAKMQAEVRAHRPRTMVIEEFVDHQVFLKSECSDLMRGAGVGPAVISFCPLPDLQPGFMSAVGVYRRVDRPGFSRRDLRMIHIVLSEVRWLHEAGFALDASTVEATPALSNRLRQVMTLLLDGWGRKQIAYEMGLSPNTIAGYIRDIYKHYNVSSHAELMRRFMTGDGGDMG
ncbi:MAG: helix-turn-helix transcriptional regulator [Phycisphaerales bacterium JB063]